MAEGQHANFEVADSRLLIYLPGWAKWVSVIALLALFCVSATSCIYFLRSGQTGGELIVFAISIAQSSAVALVFVIVLYRVAQRLEDLHTLFARTAVVVKEPESTDRPHSGPHLPPVSDQ